MKNDPPSNRGVHPPARAALLRAPVRAAAVAAPALATAPAPGPAPRPVPVPAPSPAPASVTPVRAAPIAAPVAAPVAAATAAGRAAPGTAAGTAGPRRPPPREVIASLPPFDAIDLDRILCLTDAGELARQAEVLLAQPHLGFDTESRPTFVRGQVSDGPHLVQFATAQCAWLLPLHVPGSVELVARILDSTAILKVGFGLDSDKTMLARRIGDAPRAVFDLDTHFRMLGFRGSLGLKSAVAVVLGQHFTKSKRIGTSDWSSHRLAPPQLRYAANDAFGALRIYEALRTEGSLIGPDRV